MWSWALTRPGTAMQLGRSRNPSAAGGRREPTSAMKPSRARSQPPSTTSPAPVKSSPVRRSRLGILVGDDVLGAHWNPCELTAGGGADRSDDCRAGGDGGRSPLSFQAVGRVRVAQLENVHPERRHVENRRKKIVGEGWVADDSVLDLDLLHHSKTESLRGAALELALHRLRVDRLADVLRCRELDHPDQ